MLRFPNPGSNIDNIIKIYIELYSELENMQPFSLDDISRVLATKNLATSSGYIGQEALNRSTRLDRSRDPMYNQSKMYAETYRFLGWIHPTDEGSLSYQFTYLGAHVQGSIQNPKPFMRECLIGIAYPNDILGVKGEYTLRPFYTILKAMKELGGYMSRDEIIIGPLSLKNDRVQSDFQDMIKKISELRKKNADELEKELKKVVGSTGIILAQSTRENNTRFPLASLLWADWAITIRKKDHYGKSLLYYSLTEFGNEFIDNINLYIDIRMIDLENPMYKNIKENLIPLSFYYMLERSGFDVSNVEAKILQNLKKVQEINPNIKNNNILFSPYQELSSKVMTTFFPSLLFNQKKEKLTNGVMIVSPSSSSNMIHTLHFKISSDGPTKTQDLKILIELSELYKSGKNLDNIIFNAIEKFKSYTQKDFYPLVANLLKSLGFNCINPSAGVNYARYDAIIIDETNSIPIEIKSPTEELSISMKAIRQSLENKIIMLSRQSKEYPTTLNTSTLVVGYYLPNDRAEVEGLIQAIQETYGFNVGVLDIFTLVKMAVLNTISSDSYDKSTLEKLYGYLSIATI